MKKFLQQFLVEDWVVVIMSIPLLLIAAHESQPTRLLRPWDFSRQEYWSGVPLPSPKVWGQEK